MTFLALGLLEKCSTKLIASMRSLLSWGVFSDSEPGVAVSEG